MAHDIRCTVHDSAIPCAKCLAGNEPGEALPPERIWINNPAEVTEHDQRWWYEHPMAFPTVEYVRAPLAAVEGDALCKCGHPKSRHEFYSDHDECTGCVAREDADNDGLCCEFRRAAAASSAPAEPRFEAKLLGFGEGDRIKLCEPCLRQAIDDHLVSFSSALPAVACEGE